MTGETNESGWALKDDPRRKKLPQRFDMAFKQALKLAKEASAYGVTLKGDDFLCLVEMVKAEMPSQSALNVAHMIAADREDVSDEAKP